MKGPLSRIRYTADNPSAGAAVWTELSVDQVLEEAATFPSEEESTVALIGGVSEQSSRMTTTVLPVIDALDALAAMRRGWLELTDARGQRVVIGGANGAIMRTLVDDAMQAIGYSLVSWQATGADVQLDGEAFDFVTALLRGDDVDEAAMMGDVSEAFLEGVYRETGGALVA